MAYIITRQPSKEERCTICGLARWLGPDLLCHQCWQGIRDEDGEADEA